MGFSNSAGRTPTKTPLAIKAFTRSGLAACWLLAASASHAGFLGSAVHADSRFLTSGAGFYDWGNAVAVAGAGVEFAAAPNTNNLFFDLTNATITVGDGEGSAVFQSAMRALNLEVSFLAVRLRTVLALVDPKRPFTRLRAPPRPRALLRR